MKKRFAIIYDKIPNKLDSSHAGGGGGGSGEMDLASKSAKDVAPIEASGAEGETDDFGYLIVKEASEGEANPPAKTPPKPQQKTEGEEELAGLTGYEKDIEIPEEEKPEEKIEKDEGLGFELKFGEMEKGESEKLTEFVKSHKLSQETAQALVDLKIKEQGDRKAFETQREKDLQKEIVKLKSDWQRELKTDPTFGGESYAHNLKNVSKVLTEFLPGVNKVLTQEGRMLPPVVMRDLAALADHLYKPAKVVQGDPAGVETDESEDPLSFYE